MDIDAIMTRRVVSVPMDASLRTIHDIFLSEQFHHLLVIESDRRLAGIISDRDFFRAVSPNINHNCTCPRDLATLNKKAHQIMTRYPVVLEPDAAIETAAEMMAQTRLSCLPVVDSLGIAVGIVSWQDILRYLVAPHAPAARASGAV